jgi:hypothetical protein
MYIHCIHIHMDPTYICMDRINRIFGPHIRIYGPYIRIYAYIWTLYTHIYVYIDRIYVHMDRINRIYGPYKPYAPYIRIYGLRNPTKWQLSGLHWGTP